MPPNITLQGVKTYRIKISVYSCHQAFLRSAGGQAACFRQAVLANASQQLRYRTVSPSVYAVTSVTARYASSLCR
jgi:hypothetical protein